MTAAPNKKQAAGKTTATDFVNASIDECKLKAEIKQLAALSLAVYAVKRSPEAKRLCGTSRGVATLTYG